KDMSHRIFEKLLATYIADNGQRFPIRRPISSFDILGYLTWGAAGQRHLAQRSAEGKHNRHMDRLKDRHLPRGRNGKQMARGYTDTPRAGDFQIGREYLNG